MDGKVTKPFLALATMVALAGLSFADSTVGGGRNAGTTRVTTVPSEGVTQACTSVALSTRTPTALLASRPARLGFSIVNVSSVTMGGDTPRPALVLISTGSTTNLGTAPTRSLFNTHNGVILEPLVFGSTLGDLSGARFEQKGSSVYTGTLYGLAESSSTSGFDLLGRAQVCEWY